MKFEYEGDKYIITFRREFVEPKSPRIPQPKAKSLVAPKPKPTTYPATTAIVYKVIGPAKGDLLVFAEETVGCYHRDKFSKEAGRTAALSAISEKLASGARNTPNYGWVAFFLQALWKSYSTRK